MVHYPGLGLMKGVESFFHIKSSGLGFLNSFLGFYCTKEGVRVRSWV